MVGELEVAHVGVCEPLDAVVADADVVGGPLGAELGAERGEFADAVAQCAVVGLSSGFCAEEGCGGDAGGFPFDKEFLGSGG